MSERSWTVAYAIASIIALGALLWVISLHYGAYAKEPISEPVIEETITDTQEEETMPEIACEDFTEPYEEQMYYESYGDCLTAWGGVYWNEETGLKETWYSQNVLPGGGLDIPGRHVNEQGLVCDVDGYICVASNDYSYGTVIETSLGTGKVYDSGCASGTLDVYTAW